MATLTKYALQLAITFGLLSGTSALAQNLVPQSANIPDSAGQPVYGGQMNAAWQTPAADAPVIQRLPTVAAFDSFNPPGESISAPQPWQSPSSSILPVNAAGPPTDSQRLSDLEKRYEDLQKQVKASAAKPAAKGSEFPSFKITGFTQLDTAFYGQTTKNIATVGNAQDGTGFRRARLAVQGKVAEFTAYQVEMDFATAGHPSFFDTYIDQSNLPYLGTFRVGQYCQPFSVDALTGFRNLTFLERSLPFLAFVPFRRVGMQFSNTSENQHTTWATSIFRTGGFNNAPLGDNRFATDIGDQGGYSFSGRTTHLLMYDEPAQDRYLWHIGASYDYSQLGANTATGSTSNVPFYQAKTSPEFGPLGNSETSQSFGQAFAATPVFVDSGRYAANNFNLFGFETVYQAGPLGITAEFMGTVVDSQVAGPIFYHGAYVQAAYRLTGEHRIYDKRNGTLGKIIPYTDFFSLTRGRRGIYGWGAWEVAGRLSYVDIQNPAALNGHYYVTATNLYTGATTPGTGTLTDTTFGVTWFLNAYTKCQFNWIHAFLDNKSSNPVTQGQSFANLFVGRFQVDF
jgi:phosphate-selective porin OprO/OprP